MTVPSVTRTRPLGGLSIDDLAFDLARRRTAEWSDARLCHEVGQVLSAPRAGNATREKASRLIHAPLELLARASLLPFVAPKQRLTARYWIAHVAAEYDDGDEEAPAVPPFRTESPEAAAAALVSALQLGDVAGADAAMSAFAACGSAEDLRPYLSNAILTRLAAYAHFGIALHLFPRIAAGAALPLGILTNITRELARYPHFRLTWTDALPLPTPDAAQEDISAAILATPMPASTEREFVGPTMAKGEAGIVDLGLLDGVFRAHFEFRPVAATLLRTAAHCMLQEPLDHDAYGWTHSFTLPQSFLSIAPWTDDARRAVAVAATALVGFRATIGAGTVNMGYVPPAPSVGLREAIDAGPRESASAAWHASPVERANVVTFLATRAATHPDIHLAKYTLACLDAIAFDPEATSLYLAAAAHLSSWWATQA